MLQIALRMANEMTQEDQVIDLENAVLPGFLICFLNSEV